MIDGIDKRGLAATLAVAFGPRFSFAGQPDDVTSLSTAAPIGGAELLNLGSSLVVVILAIIVVGWLYSRMQGVSHRGGELINIVASRSLGPKERILLVEIAEKQLLVGMTASQVQTLHVFEDPIVVAPVESAPHSSESKGFAKRFRAAVKEIAR